MPSITPGSNLSALIRAQLDAARAAQTGLAPSASAVKEKFSPKQGSAKDASSQGPQAGALALPASALARLKTISADDPLRHRKAFRVFLEAALVQELGAQLQTDDGFTHLVDQVLAQMEQDPHLQKATVAAAEGLLQQARAASP